MIRWFRDLSIRSKISWLTAVTSGVTLFLACGAIAIYEIATFRAALVEEMWTEARIVAYNVTSAILFEDPESAATTLEALRGESAILEAVVYGKDGRLFARYLQSPTEPIRLGPELGDEPGTFQFGQRRLRVIHQIFSGEERVGTLVIIADLSELNARIRTYVAIAVAVFALGVLIAVLLSRGGQRMITDPILHLVRVARTVSQERDYSVRAESAGADETGLLIRTFNEMLAQIQDRDTALEHARDEAQAANRAKDEFLATVSHELRTPLTPILAWVSLLRSGKLDAETRERAIESIDRSARSQAQLVEDLLDVSRIIAGKLRLRSERVEVAPLVEAAIDSMRLAADAKRLRLEAHVAAGLAVQGDSERLKQVFWNLLSNAVKFTPAGGGVNVAVEAVGSAVRISVADTGQGIPQRFLPYVFDRFRQADSSSTRTHGGLGLGLAIVRHLVELHGGTVRGDSAGEGLGSTFTVELPRLDEPRTVEARFEPAALALASDFAPALSGARILLVDDEKDTLETIAEVLRHSDAEVWTAQSANEALSVLDRTKPDLLVSDIGMPGRDGFDLIREVRTRAPERGGRIPAVALTAYARTEDRRRAASAGYQMHIAKPVEPGELVEALRRFLRDVAAGISRAIS